jgi:4-amino-4-deoxy-L-arabinose transferase-like glycosyltransferase
MKYCIANYFLDTLLGEGIMKPPSPDTVRLELPLIGLIGVVSLCWGLSINGGFQGYDDLHYFQAAQNWLHNGPSLPTDHWGGRLPYVLLLVISIKLFGVNLAALVVVNSLLLLIIIGTSWWIARLKFDSRSALFAALLAAATPLFFRSPQTFYPEALEVALFGLELGLVIVAMRSPTARRAPAILVGAGLLGGIALVLRATSAVVPIALAFFILLEVGRRPRSTLILISSLAAGYVLPLLAEALYYYLSVGQPFYRYAVDSKDGVVNAEMVGENIITRDALLNLRLAKLWSVWAPAVVRIHWTVNHLVNLFVTPSLFLTPYFGLAGIICAFRYEKTRNFAIFALILLGLQYVLFTFVFVLSPTPRYYATTVLLFCIVGGFFLSKLSFSILRFGLLTVQVMIAAMVGLTQINPQVVVEALVSSSKKVSPIYISSQTAEAAYLALMRDHNLAEGVRVGFPPIDGFTLIGWDGWPRDTLKRTCNDGRLQWKVIDMSSHPSVPWQFMNANFPRLASALPDRIASYLRRDVESTALAQRRC